MERGINNDILTQNKTTLNAITDSLCNTKKFPVSSIVKVRKL